MRVRSPCLLAGAALAGSSAFSVGVPAAATAATAVGAQPGAVSRLAAVGDPPSQTQCVAAFTAPCYDPAQLETAYNEQPLFSRGITGGGQTIVIVDAFGFPTIAADLAAFDAQFGLPAPPSLNVIQPDGPVTFDPASEDDTGWAGETTLDVE